MHGVIYAGHCSDGSRGIDLSKCRIFVFSETCNLQVDFAVIVNNLNLGGCPWWSIACSTGGIQDLVEEAADNEAGRMWSGLASPGEALLSPARLTAPRPLCAAGRSRPWRSFARRVTPWRAALIRAWCCFDPAGVKKVRPSRWRRSGKPLPRKRAAEVFAKCSESVRKIDLVII